MRPSELNMKFARKVYQEANMEPESGGFYHDFDFSKNRKMEKPCGCLIGAMVASRYRSDSYSPKIGIGITAFYSRAEKLFGLKNIEAEAITYGFDHGFEGPAHGNVFKTFSDESPSYASLHSSTKQRVRRFYDAAKRIGRTFRKEKK